MSQVPPRFVSFAYSITPGRFAVGERDAGIFKHAGTYSAPILYPSRECRSGTLARGASSTWGELTASMVVSRSNSGITPDATSLSELNARIAAIRENIRELIGQAAAYSGAADEDRTADRIADQEARLATAP